MPHLKKITWWPRHVNDVYFQIQYIYKWPQLFKPIKTRIKWHVTKINLYHNGINRIGGVIVSMLPSSAVDRGFEPRSGYSKDYKIGICCFSAKHTALRRKSKGWLARNQNNVFEWSDMSTRGLFFRWAKNPNSACWSSTKRTSSSSHWKLTCSRHDTAEKLLNWH